MPRRLVFAAVLMVGLAGLVAAQLTAAGPARATPTVAAGTAAANAAVLGIVPQAAGLTLTTTAGQASTAYEQNLSQANAWTVNLGGLGELLANLTLCGLPGLPLKEQPQVLTASSENGASSRTTAGNVAGAGTESVSVSPSPESASASTAPVSQTVPGVLQVTGTSTSSVHYVANTEQEADVSVTESVSLLNGLVQINGMRWTASMHSGTTNTSSASFTFGNVMIGKTAVPINLPSTASAATVVKVLNTLLGTFGLNVVLPVESVEPSTDTVAIGPLQLVFSGSPLDNKLLGPINSVITNLESFIAGQSQPGSDCANIHHLLFQVSNSADGLLNLGIVAAEGSGAVSIDLGGASTQVQPATNFTDPFGGGNPPPARLPPSTPGGVVPPSSGVTIPTSPAGVAPVTSPAAVVTSPGSDAGGTTISSPPPKAGVRSAAGLSLARCVTTSPAGGTGCWRGLGSIVAGVVVALGAGLLAADLVYGNRTRRRRRRSRRAVV